MSHQSFHQNDACLIFFFCSAHQPEFLMLTVDVGRREVLRCACLGFIKLNIIKNLLIELYLYLNIKPSSAL
jgi:hypothetical protein